MTALLTQLVVTGLWILVGSAMGIWIYRVGRPYGRVKLSIHVFLTVFVLAGFVSSFLSLRALTPPTLIAMISLVVLGLALLAVIVVGIRMIVARESVGNMPLMHAVSVGVMLLAIVVAAVSVALRI